MVTSEAKTVCKAGRPVGRRGIRAREQRRFVVAELQPVGHVTLFGQLAEGNDQDPDDQVMQRAADDLDVLPPGRIVVLEQIDQLPAFEPPLRLLRGEIDCPLAGAPRVRDREQVKCGEAIPVLLALGDPDRPVQWRGQKLADPEKIADVGPAFNPMTALPPFLPEFLAVGPDLSGMKRAAFVGVNVAIDRPAGIVGVVGVIAVAARRRRWR